MQSFSYSSLIPLCTFIAAIVALLPLDAKPRRLKDKRFEAWRFSQYVKFFYYPLITCVPVWGGFYIYGSFDTDRGYREVVYGGIITDLAAVIIFILAYIARQIPEDREEKPSAAVRRGNIYSTLFLSAGFIILV